MSILTIRPARIPRVRQKGIFICREVKIRLKEQGMKERNKPVV